METNTPDPNRLVNLREMARQLQLPMRWVEREALAGRIPCLRAGKKLRFNAAAVQEALLDRAAELHFQEQVPEDASTDTRRPHRTSGDYQG